MTKGGSGAAFNLLDEPWIEVEARDGQVGMVGIRALLRDASMLRVWRAPTPLAGVALQRFLAAFVHHGAGITSYDQIASLIAAGEFPIARLDKYADEYSERFDLFHRMTPFYQSGDLPLVCKPAERKPVAYLAPELPCGTAINHFRHLYDTDVALCPPCAAFGLLQLPCFATSGGQGLKPGINGVPPLYVMPVGETVFESIALALVASDYQPDAASGPDLPFWGRSKPLVSEKKERSRVGYIDSLTLPPRRVRLHPVADSAPCSRCGRAGNLLVRTMVFGMGESRAKDAPLWVDPFTALRAPRKAADRPLTVRPDNRVVWREFQTLFLSGSGGSAQTQLSMRPRILDQMERLAADGVIHRAQAKTYRCVGLRTDGKAKVFEWAEHGFDVPSRVLTEGATAQMLRGAVGFAEAIARKQNGVLFNAARPAGCGKSSSRYEVLGQRMESSYWIALAAPFRALVLRAGDEAADLVQLYREWLDAVVRTARRTLREAVEQIGDTGAALRMGALALSSFDKSSAVLVREARGSETPRPQEKSA